MPVIDAHTEQTIKETAMRIFFVEGRLHATTEVIAKEAGINRGLIHYYFKGRDKLFEAVFKEAMMMVHNRMQELFLSKRISFRKKISGFVDMFIDQNIKYPYLETFLITELNREDFTMPVPMTDDLRKQMLEHIEEDLKNEIKEGRVPKMSAEQFILNAISLCAYPAFAKPMVKRMLNIDDKAYFKMIHERRNLIMKVLFRD